MNDLGDKFRFEPYPSGQKFCTGCGKKKPLTEYHKNKGAYGGVTHRCKQCRCKDEQKRWDRKRKQGFQW